MVKFQVTHVMSVQWEQDGYPHQKVSLKFLCVYKTSIENTVIDHQFLRIVSTVQETISHDLRCINRTFFKRP